MTARGLGRRLLRSREGATATEVALILPVLLLLMMGVMEGARVLNAWVVLTNETREAARWGVAGVRDTSDANLASDVSGHLKQRVGQTLDLSHLVVITTVTAPGTAGGNVSVEAKYAVNMISPLTKVAIGDVTVNVQSTMRAE